MRLVYEIMSYYGLVAARALEETKKIWTVHWLWGGIAVPLSAFFFILWLKPKLPRPMTWYEILLTAIFGFVVCWVGSYLINFVRVPAILHNEQYSRIVEFEESRPVVSPQEQRKRDEVNAMLRDFSNEELTALRYVLDHGKISDQNLGSLEHSSFHSAMHKAEENHLVLVERVEPKERQHGPSYIHTRGPIFPERRFTINPSFESALQFYFESEVP